MNVFYKISVALISVTFVVIQGTSVVSVAQDVRKIAKEITVRIDGEDKANSGSGVIVKRNGNTYTVLTNWHVVEKQTIYKILTTKDEQVHDVNPNSIKRVSPSLDLAELQFTSTTIYEEANIGDFNEFSEGTPIYISGWLNPVDGIPKPIYLTLTGTDASIKTQPESGGYALVYSVSGNYIGMSGGPVLNEAGEVIAINGIAASAIDGVIGLSLGIPINRYQTPLPKQRTLEELLKAGRLREANDKTWEMLLEGGDSDKSNDLNSEEVKKLDCKKLRQIDENWSKYSNGKFGFRKQSELYNQFNADNTLGESNLTSYNHFGAKVGWRKNDGWLSYNELSWSKDQPVGYFPIWFIYKHKQNSNIYGLPKGYENLEDSEAFFSSPGTSLSLRLKLCL